MSGGLTLTAAQLRASTASMLTSTLSAVTPAEGEEVAEVQIQMVNVFVRFI